MAQEGGPNRQNQDRNGSSGSSLFLWAGLIVATGLLVIFWISPLFTRELEVSDFERLVQANARNEDGTLKEGAPGYVDVRTQRGSKTTTYRYSNPHKIVVNDRSITGQVDVAPTVVKGTNKETL